MYELGIRVRNWSCNNTNHKLQLSGCMPLNGLLELCQTQDIRHHQSQYFRRVRIPFLDNVQGILAESIHTTLIWNGSNNILFACWCNDTDPLCYHQRRYIVPTNMTTLFWIVNIHTYKRCMLSEYLEHRMARDQSLLRDHFLCCGKHNLEHL